uniref:Uncharacterized protein n=1 Tax=Ditylum brightwellii TaxID=49249 RepID=A0A6U3Z476_9STRA|mmetsp:Transcript_9615/g.14349  ORF Transcript_9615/g.14349 Transcript_9615/m.14349 type:complete len:159 (+) Transcript_9615:295-771(+)
MKMQQGMNALDATIHKTFQQSEGCASYVAEKTKQALREGAHIVHKEHNAPQKRDCKMLRDQVSTIMQNLEVNASNHTHQTQIPAGSSFMPNRYYLNTTSLLPSNTDVVTSNSAVDIIRGRDLMLPLDALQQQLLMQGELQQQGYPRPLKRRRKRYLRL